ncbi:MAG: flagellar motor protein MotB [Burkholderiaceae bacterium]|jgi:chemotaxis protein MotB
MADSSEKATIQIKRIKKVAGGHHGGAWKIAYADFVTAMMAFFLLMWLLGSTAKGDLQGISDYFKTPLKVAMGGGSGSGDSSSVIKGGGTDLTRANGQVRNGETPAKKAVVDIHAAEAERARREKEYLKGLGQKISDLIAASPQLAPFKNQFLMDMTAEGLRIQIVDDQSRPMFDSGRAELKPYTSVILRQLASTLNDVDNRISLSGHTDGAAYAGGEKGYSNWELSADRANASRRELIAGGLDEKKLIRVEGLGSAVMLNPADGLDPVNRRITIVVLNKQTEQAVLHEGVELSTSTSTPLEPVAIKEASVK